MALCFKEGLAYASQPHLINQIADLMNCRDCKPTLTPLRIDYEIGKNEGSPHPGFTNISYATVLGKANYLACLTRPEITNAIRVLGSHMANPSKRAWIQLLNLCKYLWTTRHWVLTIGLPSPFILPGLNPDVRIDQPFF